MIIYRPHRGSLSDAMKECRTFDNEQEMKEYVAEGLNGWFLAGTHGVTAEDISIAEDGIDDPRTGWNNTRYVRFKWNDSQIVVGMCSDDFLQCTCEVKGGD